MTLRSRPARTDGGPGEGETDLRRTVVEEAASEITDAAAYAGVMAGLASARSCAASSLRKPPWFYDATGEAQPIRSRGNAYPAEGAPADDVCRCGEPLCWIYDYKRRRPRVRCLTCDPLVKASD